MKNKSNFNINITLTFSKSIALLTLLIGSVFAYITKDAGIVYATFSTVTLILGVKQVQDGMTFRKGDKKENETNIS